MLLRLEPHIERVLGTDKASQAVADRIFERDCLCFEQQGN